MKMFQKYALKIDLIEPIIYLRKEEESKNILRGCIKLKLKSKVTMVKNIMLEFQCISTTLWPEEQDIWDTHILINSVISIHNSNKILALKKGAYQFPFEILLSNDLFDSIDFNLGTIKYNLVCKINLLSKHNNNCFHSNKLYKQIQTQKFIFILKLPSITYNNYQQQTHTLNRDGQQLNIISNKLYFYDEIFEILFYFNSKCLVKSIIETNLKLVQKQKLKSITKQKIRIILNEFVLNNDLKLIIIKNEKNEIINLKLNFKLGNTIIPSLNTTTIKIKHWFEINLKLTCCDNNTIKNLIFNIPIRILQFSDTNNHLNLPNYNESSISSTDKHNDNLISLITSPPPLYET